MYFKLIKSKFILLILSIFYDIIFIDKFWTNPKLFRAYIGLIGIVLIALSGILYFIEKNFFFYDISSLFGIIIILGTIMFIIGGFRRGISISFDINKSREYLMSLGTILCILSDIRQSSAIIEVIISFINSKKFILKNPEGIIQFAYDIWREALIRKGLTLSSPQIAKSSVIKTLSKS
ncbi:MAG: hypothetical protein NO483_00715 [Candidatus Methanomethylicia archaeon]|nr:hypothetical protein [Candidatus Methanomethylicia archaeon]